MRVAIVPVAVVVGLVVAISLSGCATETSTSSSDKRACKSEIDAMLAAGTAANAPDTEFNTRLRAAANGPASGFAAVADAASGASTADANLADAYRALAAVSISEYAEKADAAADAIDTLAKTEAQFAVAAHAYTVSETTLTTIQLNQAATAAAAAPLAAATAISNATAVASSLGGDICS